jgi:hypothetical protein
MVVEAAAPDNPAIHLPKRKPREELCKGLVVTPPSGKYALARELGPRANSLHASLFGSRAL